MLVRLLRTITTCLFQLCSSLGHSPFRPLIDLQLNRDREQLRTLPYQNSWWEISTTSKCTQTLFNKKRLLPENLFAVAFSLLVDFPSNCNVVYSFSLDGRLIGYFVLEIECHARRKILATLICRRSTKRSLACAQLEFWAFKDSTHFVWCSLQTLSANFRLLNTFLMCCRILFIFSVAR